MEGKLAQAESIYDINELKLENDNLKTQFNI